MTDKLTGKQRRFCELVASGKTQADAYREAYDSNGCSQTVRNSASKLMKQEYIKSTVDSIIKRKSDLNIARHVSSQDLVTRTLRDHITGTIDLEPTQVQSLSILAKTSGMYTTRIEDVTERSSDDIATDLKRKLLQLSLITDDDVEGNVSDVTH
tara:strand:- start:117 stop:578 length:462 start_codon:yes stop_codon:yes gene_type:complete